MLWTLRKTSYSDLACECVSITALETANEINLQHSDAYESCTAMVHYLAPSRKCESCVLRRSSVKQVLDNNLHKN